MRMVSSMDVSYVLNEAMKRIGKPLGAISRETGVDYDTIKNINKKRPQGTNAAIFLEFFARYEEVRDVVDEYLDLKHQSQKKQKNAPNPLLSQKEAVRL